MRSQKTPNGTTGSRIVIGLAIAGLLAIAGCATTGTTEQSAVVCDDNVAGACPNATSPVAIDNNL